MRRRFSDHLPESTVEIIRSMEKLKGKTFAVRLAVFLEVIQMRELVHACRANPHDDLIDYRADAITESIVAKILAGIRQADRGDFVRIASHLNQRRGSRFVRVDRSGSYAPKYRKSKKKKD
jgi:hypothetical protein